MQATEALCYLSITDIKKTFCNVVFFCKNEACANCAGWNATTVIWLPRGSCLQAGKMTLSKWQRNCCAARNNRQKLSLFYVLRYLWWCWINKMSLHQKPYWSSTVIWSKPLYFNIWSKILYRVYILPLSVSSLWYNTIFRFLEPQFYIQLVYRPHFGTWILLFGPFGLSWQ